MSECQSISLRYHQEGTMYFSGIDQHKRDCVITTYDASGQRVKQQRVPNEPSRLHAYLASLPGPHRAVVKSTGFWYWLADLLGELGVDLVPAHAPRLKAIAAAKVKADRLNADLLAQLLRAAFAPAAHRIGSEARGIRDLMWLRVAVTRILVDLHEHPGQLVAYARINQIVPPWSRKGWLSGGRRLA